MTFKNTIKEVRLNNRLSKVEMAKKLDVSEGTIRMWENGKNEPSEGVEEVHSTSVCAISLAYSWRSPSINLGGLFCIKKQGKHMSAYPSMITWLI